MQRPKKVREEKKVNQKRTRDEGSHAAAGGHEENISQNAAPMGAPAPKAPKLVVNDVPHRILFAQVGLTLTIPNMENPSTFPTFLASLDAILNI